ncbi:hypothetical protein BSL78_14014 [Apostichopus japonicus]|uniref:RNA-binding protein PNO1 n=1 Tax=Stichopus japonicus TaxID=307972 RepID=A0A2G8KMB9_STIJA|nr:hypothetical protein BSL78_14014 [Apostichopus japonicus]
MAASAEETTLPETSEQMEESDPSKDTDGFIQVTKKKGRKRKVEEEKMDVVSGKESKKRPQFPPLQGNKLLENSKEVRKIAVPPNRYTPLKENWMKIFSPVVEHLKLQIRFNIRARTVELRASKDTKEINALQKGQDFVKAFILGFDVEDALALLRLDELYIESFEVTDGSPPSKVYGNMRAVATRSAERF